MNSFLTVVAGLISVLTAAGVAANQTAGVVHYSFSDGEFIESDWELITIEVGLGGTTTASRSPDGGNPGPFMQITCTTNDPIGDAARVYGIHTKVGASYWPRSQGAITSMDYSEDALLLDGFGDGQAAGPALVQDGHVYFVRGVTTGLAGTWQWIALLGLQAQDFALLTTAGADDTSHPDFSSSGSRIDFGFVRANGSREGTMGYTTVAGIDNWSVELDGGLPTTGEETIAAYVDTGAGLERFLYTDYAEPFDLVIVANTSESILGLEFVFQQLPALMPGVFRIGYSSPASRLDMGEAADYAYYMPLYLEGCAEAGVNEVLRLTYLDAHGTATNDQVVVHVRGSTRYDPWPSNFNGHPGYLSCGEQHRILDLEPWSEYGQPDDEDLAGAVVLNPRWLPVKGKALSIGRLKARF